MAKEKERGDIATRFKAGNQFWKARSSHGRNPIYSNPQDLADAICQYFQWVEETPLFEHKPMVVAGIVEDVYVEKPRPMLITACARFCGVSHDVWNRYKDNPDFSGIVEDAEQAIREQKFAGAAAGFFNANIIARDLGLKDSSEVKLEAPQGIVFNMNYTGKHE